MGFDWRTGMRGGAQGAAAGSSFGPWGAAIGGGIGALTGFGGGNNDKRVNRYLDQIPGVLHEGYDPYINAGKQSLGHLGDISGEYENMYKDPNAIIQRLGAGYHESPGYKWKLGQGENAINNAAAMNGMIGTGQHQQQAGELANHLADQDYNDYLKNILGIYGEGLHGRTGIEQDIFGKGYDASSNLATSLANALFGRAGIERQRGSESNALNSDMYSSILSLLNNR